MGSISYDPNLQEEKDDRKWFGNVKLIGEIDDGTSIYIEDYAYTYLQQCANHDLSYELSAALIGEYQEEAEQVIIYGVILIKADMIDTASKWLDQKAIDIVGEKIEKYFPGGKCIGWMHTQPGYGLMATTQEMAVHRELLDEDCVLMLMDPVYGLEAFYVCQHGSFEQKAGFCIYYEKNEWMQNYIEDYPLEKKKNLEENDKVAGEFRELGAKRKKEVEKARKRSRMISIAIAGMLITTAFIMGIYSQKRKINNLEKDVVNIHEHYSAIEHRVPNHPVELVFTSALLESNKEPEPQLEDELAANAEVQPRPQAQPQVEVEPQVKVEPEHNIHVVKMGDSLMRISYKYYNTISRSKEIAALNNISDSDRIYIGQELKVPK